MAELAIRSKPAMVPESGPRIGLALGGGGARGLAHILILEALDELGIRPHVISGTSIGAIYGASYASGLQAKYIRAHTEEVLSQRVDLARHLYASRAEAASRWLNLVPIRPAILNAESLLEVLLPSKVARDFGDLQIPLQIVATDFYAQEQRVFSSGQLRRAVAASMALPAIFTPVTIDGRTLVDGGLVNPLPFDLIAGHCDITIAVDVSGAPTPGGKHAQPSAIEVMMAASQIFQRSIVREKLKAMQPDIFIECPVDVFTVLDFHRFKDVLAAAAPVKDELKRKLDRVLSSPALEFLPAPQPPIEATPSATAVKIGRGKKRLNQAKALIQRRRKKKKSP
jgi:NTE family protein